MRVLGAMAVGLALVAGGCGGLGEGPDAIPTTDVGAEVRTAVAEALPTPTPTATPDINATIEAGMAATAAALPAPTPESPPTPKPTPVPDLSTTAQALTTPIPTAEPTPTTVPIAEPPATPTPTPSSTGSYDFGPLSGELGHGSSAAEFRRAGLWGANVMVDATFINPYRGTASKKWSYGFVIRQDDNDDLRFILSSTGWEVNALVEGKRQTLAHNNTSYLNTEAGDRNHFMVITMTTQSLLFVNGKHGASVNVSSVMGAGDVLIGANLYGGDGIPGAVIRYEGLRGNSLVNSYRAGSGQLIQPEPDSFGAHFAAQQYRDFVVEAEFPRPVPGRWDLGFLFRNTVPNRMDVLVVSNGQGWHHYTRNVGDSNYMTVDEGPLNRSGLQTYQLMLVALGDSGWFFINGQHVTKLDLSDNQDTGSLAVIGDFLEGNESRPEHRYFRVWAP